MVGQKMKIAYPIFLVLSGLLISFAPGIPEIEIAPDVVFLIFLPPILFEAAWYTSWKDFSKWKLPIISLAVGLVIVTSIVMALTANALIPGMTLALGFLLGSVNSPPDAVAATAVLKDMKLPKRIITILEGESLVNDASSLIVFKFALAAIMTGQFVMSNAVSDFFIISGMGITIGLAIGFIFSWIIKWLPGNSNVDTVLTLIIPYILYVVAEYFHFSGVMAVVSGGLLMSSRYTSFLSHTTRIQSASVWKTLIFMLNAAIFILIGLELPVVLKAMNGYDIREGIFYAVILGGVAIATRVLYIFLFSYLPSVITANKNKKAIKQGWKEPIIMSVSAMRGVVSLAAALSIPYVMTDGSPFPHRNMILFITFVIILITLVGQGLMLPVLLKLFKMPTDKNSGMLEERQEAIIQQRIKNRALQQLLTGYGEAMKSNTLINHIKIKLENDIELINNKMKCIKTNEKHREAVELSRAAYLDVLKAQREELHQTMAEHRFDDDVIRNLEMELDLDEVKLTGFDN